MGSVGDWFRMDIASADPAEIAARLQRDGVVTFAGVHSRADFLAAASRYLAAWPHADADAEGITVLTPDTAAAGMLGGAGFGSSELHPHTEASSSADPPALLMLCCVAPAEHGGQSFLADGPAVYHELDAREPLAVKALQDSESAWFGMNPSWCGPVFDTAADGWVTVRLRLDDLVRFGPAVRPFTASLSTAVGISTMALPLAAGEGYLIDNRRMLHGRRAFTGSRIMHRIVGNPLPHIAFRPGFDPAQAGAGTAREFAPSLSAPAPQHREVRYDLHR